MIVAENFPSKMPCTVEMLAAVFELMLRISLQEVRQLGAGLRYLVSMHFVETRSSNSHHRNQEEIRGLVGGEGWLVHF